MHSGLGRPTLCIADSVLGSAGGVSIGKFIIPYPHVCQVLVPEEGCRLILGTDGLWDFISASRVFSLVGRMAPAAAAAALCKQAFIAQVCTCLLTLPVSSGERCKFPPLCPPVEETAAQLNDWCPCTEQLFSYDLEGKGKHQRLPCCVVRIGACKGASYRLNAESADIWVVACAESGV